VVTKVEDVEFEVVATRESVLQPRDRFVGEATGARRSNDDLESKCHGLEPREDAA
jgi:hypothetical protein